MGPSHVIPQTCGVFVSRDLHTPPKGLTFHIRCRSTKVHKIQFKPPDKPVGDSVRHMSWRDQLRGSALFDPPISKPEGSGHLAAEAFGPARAGERRLLRMFGRAP